MNLSKSFNMRGTEEAFEEMLNLAINKDHPSPFQYLEIGCATGNTLLAVADHLNEELNLHRAWRVTGIDLVNGSFFNANQFLLNSGNHFVGIRYFGDKHIQPIIGLEALNDIDIILKRNLERITPEPESVDFALIDGCHGKPCVIADFCSIEASIKHGGIVAFHDAGFEDQGTHHQSHCEMPISVISALTELGMPGPGRCGAAEYRAKDWKLIKHIEGDKSPGNAEQNGHGFAFFQKKQ